MVTLTFDEAECLANHLEYYIIQEIRDDEEYDSILYLGHLLDVYRKCRDETKRRVTIESTTPTDEPTTPTDDWERLKQELGVDNFCEVKP